MSLQSLGNRPRQIIRTMMPAQKRHNGRAIFRHRNHRRLRHLVRQQRRNEPDQRPRRHHGDDGATCGKQCLHLHPRLIEQPVGGGHPRARANKLAAEKVRNGAAGDGGLFA
jgi:hypothetical protein